MYWTSEAMLSEFDSGMGHRCAPSVRLSVLKKLENWGNCFEGGHSWADSAYNLNLGEIKPTFIFISRM